MKNNITKIPNKDLYASINDVCNFLGVKLNQPAWTDKFGLAMRSYLIKTGERRIKTLSLFSGAGGLDIGFTDLGFDIVASVEIEKQFCSTLEHNTGAGKYFNDSKVHCVDVREFSADGLNDIEWIIGGPPCQTFSAAGRRVAGVLGTSDSRGTLFKEYVRILKQIKPKGFLFENVFGIVGAQNGEPWKEIQSSFREAGYNLFYRILDAADYGTPQHRERLVIIGLKEGEFFFLRPTHGPDSRTGIPFYNAGTAISGVVSKEDLTKCEIKGRYQTLLKEIPPGLNYSYFTQEMGHPRPVFAWRSKFSDFMYKADPAEPVRTITATGRQYTGPLHWDNRYFTCEEYKRLQSFPDSYEILGAKPTVLKQIGNSVPPQLARMLALAIRLQVFNMEFPLRLETIDESFEMTYKNRKRSLSKQYRERAMAKLKEQSQSSQSIVGAYDYYLTISEKFEFLQSSTKGQFKVKCKWEENKLSIRIIEPESNQNYKVNVTIRPSTQWSLPVDYVVLESESKGWDGICAAWRVLDHELIANNLKADLIQLNGYYLYDSKLICEINHDEIENSRIIDSITRGECTQKIISSEVLAKLWNIDKCELRDCCQFIKKLGYDVRNSNTNPQMVSGDWLIPYKFPTLVPQSLQLYKQL